MAASEAEHQRRPALSIQPESGRRNQKLRRRQRKRAEKPVEQFLDIANRCPAKSRDEDLSSRRLPPAQRRRDGRPHHRAAEAALEIARRRRPPRRAAVSPSNTSPAATSATWPRARQSHLQHHFGRGIVNTPGDFGILGERPASGTARLVGDGTGATRLEHEDCKADHDLDRLSSIVAPPPTGRRRQRQH